MWTPTLVLALAAQIAVIQGEVRDAESHRVISYARVALSSARTTINSQYTDRSGRFRFEGLPGPTYYLLSVDHPSYNSAEMDGPSLFGILPGMVQIELVPKKKEVAGLPDTVSVAELLLPKNARKELDRARGYVKSGRLDLAEKALVEAIRKHSDTGDLYYELATVYFNQERDAEAEELAQQAHLRKHGIADVHLLLAKIELKRQNFEEVAEQLEIYLREAPPGPMRDRVRQGLEEYRKACGQACPLLGEEGWLRPKEEVAR